MKRKIKRILAISMALSTLFCSTAFATPIDLANSTEDVQNDTLTKTEGTDYYDDETTNEWADGQISEEVRVTVDVESQFTITIPKEIVLDGDTKRADYEVNVKGDIAGDQDLWIYPDDNFVMNEAGGKADVTATVTQNEQFFFYNEILNDGKTVPGSIEALDLTAGEWSGKFYFNINFENNGMDEDRCPIGDGPCDDRDMDGICDACGGPVLGPMLP